VRLSPLGTSATVGLLYQPRMIDYVDYGAVGAMRMGRGNRSTRRKPAPVPLWPPQIPHDLTSDRTRAAAVGSQQLTAWAMARPKSIVHIKKGDSEYIPTLLPSGCHSTFIWGKRNPSHPLLSTCQHAMILHQYGPCPAIRAQPTAW
jgi:hypothetical protein